jgi:hypothetical protein
MRMLPRKAAVVAATAGLCCVTLAAATAARADVRYLTETRMGDGTAAGEAGSDADKGDSARMPTLRATTFVKGERERVETVMEMGAVKSNTVTLTLCGKGERRVVTMDPDLKLYTVTPMDGTDPGDQPSPAAGTDKPQDRRREKTDTGLVVTTYDVRDLGTEKVGGVMARHFMVSLRMERSGCAGKGDTTMKMETWVAPGQLGGLHCEERVPSASPRVVRNDEGCRITFETRGDTGMLKDVFGGIVVRQRMYNGDKVVMTQEVMDISSEPLSDSLFAPGADYKQVSQQEFAEAKRKAQMASLSAAAGPAGAPGAPGATGTPGAAGAPGADAASAGEKAPAPRRRRGGLLGGLGGAVGGALGGALPGLGGGAGLGGVGSGVLSALGGKGGLGGLANLLGSGALGGFGGYSPVALPGSAGQALSLLGSLTTTK